MSSSRGGAKVSCWISVEGELSRLEGKGEGRGYWLVTPPPELSTGDPLPRQ